MEALRIRSGESSDFITGNGGGDCSVLVSGHSSHCDISLAPVVRIPPETLGIPPGRQSMNEYFRPLRRKLGTATLFIAGVFVVAWIRGLSVQDLVLIGEGQRVVTKGDVLVILTSSARDGLVWSRQEREGISWLAGWQVRPTDGDDYFDPFEAIGDMIPNQLDFQMEFYGLEVGKYHAKSGETFSFCRISYAPIVIPLTLLSGILLLSKPRSKPAATQSPPHQNAQDAIQVGQ